MRSGAAVEYSAAVRETGWVRRLVEGTLRFEWAPARLVVDDPAKALGRGRPADLLRLELDRIIAPARAELHAISPYFVPRRAGVARFARLEAAGVRARVLTSAFESTDVRIVHVGYAKRRKALLRAGVELYELRRDASANASQERSRRAAARAGSVPGSDGESLHAKTFVVDRETIFVGSFNFDPRSAELNTEMGFVIESPTLGAALAERFEAEVPRAAYEVRLDAHGDLEWIDRRDGSEVRLRVEPGTSWLERCALRVLALLPLESLL